MSNFPPEPPNSENPSPGNYPAGSPQPSFAQDGGAPSSSNGPLPDDLSQGWLPEDKRQHPISPLPAPKLFGFQSLLPFKMGNALRHPGELPWLITAYAISIIAYVAAFIYLAGSFVDAFSNNVDAVHAIDSMGFGQILMQLVVLAVYMPIIAFIARAMMYAQIRLIGVRITPTQFPEAYQMVAEAAHAAGLRRVPDAYVQLGNGTINAFASGHGHRRFVVIYSDLFEVGGAPRNPNALRFVIGHEVGHIAAGHTSYFRLILISLFMQIPWLGSTLSRAQEYTADNFGYRFCPEGAREVMGVLAAGKYLCNEVNFDELANRAVYERGFFTWLSNLNLSHPATTWRAHALRDRSEPGRLIWRPKHNPEYPLSMIPAAEPSAQWADPLQAMDFLGVHPEDPANQHWGTVVTEAKKPASERDRKVEDFLFTGWIPPHLRNQWGVPAGGGAPAPAQQANDPQSGNAQPDNPYSPGQPHQGYGFNSFAPTSNQSYGQQPGSYRADNGENPPA